MTAAFPASFVRIAGFARRSLFPVAAAFASLGGTTAAAPSPPPLPFAPPAGFTCSAVPLPQRVRLGATRGSVATTGIQKLLLLRVRFPDDTADPVSQAEAESTLADADTWFRRISHGAFGFDFTISPVLHLATARTEYEGPAGFDRFVDAARAAGIEAGFDYRDYDLEIVRHTGVDGFAGGNARLGERGAQIQIPGAWVVMHELGHNLGLSHANAWDTSGPGFHLASPPLPSNYLSLPDPRSIPMHPESTAGHDSVVGPGHPIEYGDPWDIMGSGEADFGASSKETLNWLPETARIAVAAGRNTHRIHAELGTATLPAATPRELRIPGRLAGPAGARDYSVQLPAPRLHFPLPAGVVVRWIDPTAGHGGSLLLDVTPGSRGGTGDAVLPIGRTFSDPISGVHVTPVAQGLDSDRRWVDVVTWRNSDSTNAPPRIQLTADRTVVAPGETVRFEISGADPDGDALAYFWDFGDGTEPDADSVPSVSRTWLDAGDRTVRVEVSDMRGGVAHAHVAVRVGTPLTRRVRGVVRDPGGGPVPGVRVYTGPQNPERPGMPQDLIWTDAQGAFTLTGLAPGRHFVSAFHPDYLVPRYPPIPLETGDREDFEILATPLPRVSASAPAELPESIGFTNLFTFHRTGPVDQALTILFRLGGTASGASDYVAPWLDRVVIPVGSATASLAFPMLDDTAAEGPETLSATVADPVRYDRTDPRGETYSVYYPGWEVIELDGTAYWVQTRPDYVPDAKGEAEIVVMDDDTSTDHVVSIVASALIALEDPLVESSFELSRTGATQLPLTVQLETSGSATPGSDYESLPGRVSFAADETTVSIPVRPLRDATEEPEETVRLGIRPDPAYGIGQGSAIVNIRDRLVYPQTLSLGRTAAGMLQFTLRGAPGSRLVLEASPDLTAWHPVRTNLLFNTDSATVLLSPPDGPRFFRTIRP